MNVTEYLHKAAELNAERNAAYGDNHIRSGAVLTALFPNGITLRSTKDHERFAIIVSMVAKLTRYTVAWGGPINPDNMRDLTVYAAMLEATDEQQQQS